MVTILRFDGNLSLYKCLFEAHFIYQISPGMHIMLTSILLAATLHTAAELPVLPGLVEEQRLANESVESYRNHHSGTVVYDYFVCHAMFQRNIALFEPINPDNTFPSPHDLWNIESPANEYSVSGPSDVFWSTVNGLVEARVFFGYDEIGHAECQRLLNRHEMSWREVFALQENTD
jgi:hypothetical protein